MRHICDARHSRSFGGDPPGCPVRHGARHPTGDSTRGPRPAAVENATPEEPRSGEAVRTGACATREGGRHEARRAAIDATCSPDPAITVRTAHRADMSMAAGERMVAARPVRARQGGGPFLSSGRENVRIRRLGWSEPRLPASARSGPPLPGRSGPDRAGPGPAGCRFGGTRACEGDVMGGRAALHPQCGPSPPGPLRTSAHGRSRHSCLFPGR